MHIFNIATLFLVLTLAGVEFSVSAFVNPAAWRLEPEPQLKMLSRFALVLGRVMPVWYPICSLLLAVETWFHWHQPGFVILLIADAFWLVAILASILFLVPLNNRIAAGDTGWQGLHRIWDSRHRARIVALSIAALLLADVLVR